MVQYIDWETEFNKKEGLSLKKMPVTQYVRNTSPIAVATATNRDGPATTQWSAPWGLSNGFCAAHNAPFDASVSNHFADHTPEFWFDTMAMIHYHVAQGNLSPDTKRALSNFGDKLNIEQDDMEEYVTRDVEILQKLFGELVKWDIPEKELRLIDLHVRMTSEPVLGLNKKLLGEKAVEVSEIGAYLRKNENFAELLREQGTTPETKQGKLGLGYAFAKSDAFMKDLQKHGSPATRELVRLRLDAMSNINRTRAQRFLSVGEPFPCPLWYYGAHTGRSSGRDKLNMQNLPRKGGLRKCITAPEGHKLVICDSSQVEVRTIATEAGEDTLLDVFRQGRDPYIEFALQIYPGRRPDSITKTERSVAKAAMLALQYKQSAYGFMMYCHGYNIPMDYSTAQYIVSLYRATYPRIVQFWSTLCDRVKYSNGVLELPSGRKIVYPDMTANPWSYKRALVFSRGPKGERQETKLWPGIIVENYIQAVARDIVVLEQTLELSKYWKVAISVHDEVALCVPENQAEEAKAHALEVFATSPDWMPGIPVKGEAIISNDYGEKP